LTLKRNLPQEYSEPSFSKSKRIYHKDILSTPEDILWWMDYEIADIDLFRYMILWIHIENIREHLELDVDI